MSGLNYLDVMMKYSPASTLGQPWCFTTSQQSLGIQLSGSKHLSIMCVCSYGMFKLKKKKKKLKTMWGKKNKNEYIVQKVILFFYKMKN